jgi:hypothetical protein
MRATAAARHMAAPPWRYRAAVLSRLLAALLGGYALAAALAAVCARHLPALGMPRSDAVAWGSMLALMLMPAVMMGCFACRHAWQAWLGSLGVAALLAATAWLPGATR